MKRALIAGMAVAFAFGSTAASAQDRAGWPDSFTVGTASQGGTYFAYGSGCRRTRHFRWW